MSHLEALTSPWRFLLGEGRAEESPEGVRHAVRLPLVIGGEQHVFKGR